MANKKYRVSADIGGTFTDIVFYDTETGEYLEGKILSSMESENESKITAELNFSYTAPLPV